ncbi:unnamed protein product [Heterobilharzia americana]|nr:unnamed protein product [Heterobilharzia americana]
MISDEKRYRFSSPINLQDFEGKEVVQDYSLSKKDYCTKRGYESVTNLVEGKSSHENLHLQLNDAKSQVERFRAEFLRLSKERIDEQCKLAKVVELLRTQLEIVSQERDQVITKTNMESKQTCEQFEHLKNCVNQLLETNTEQETLMSEMSERLDVSNKEIGNYKSVLERINSTIQRFDASNQLPDITDCKGYNVTESSYNRLDTLLKTFEEREYVQNIEIEKLKTKVDVLRSQHEMEISRIEEKHESALRKQCEQLQDQLNITVVRAEKATLEAKSLTTELINTKSNYEKEIGEKRERIEELEKELNNLSIKQNSSDVNSRKAPESVLDTTQKELIKMKYERDLATSQLSSLCAKLEAKESYITELDQRLSKQITVNQTIRNQLDETNKLNTHLQSSMKSVEIIMQRLQCTIVNDLNLNTDWNWGTMIKVDQLTEFTNHVIKLISELYMKSVMNKESRSQTKRLRRQVEELNIELDKFKSTIKYNQRSLMECKKSLAVKINELETVISERDYYLQIINEQTEELSTVKADCQHQIRELTEQIKLLKTQSFCQGKCSQLKSRKGTSTERYNTYTKILKKPITAGSLLSDQRLASVEYEKQASENAIDEMKKQMNETKSKCGKIQGRQENHDFSIGNRTDEKLNDFKEKLNEGLLHTNTSNSTTYTSTVMKLQRRLADLEMNMYKAGEEKECLRNRNEQLTDLLRRMTEQNHRLTKELDNRVMECGVLLKSKNYPFHRIMNEISSKNYHNTNFLSFEKIKMNHNSKVWNNNDKIKTEKHYINSFNEGNDLKEVLFKRSFDDGDYPNSTNQEVEITSPNQSNHMKGFYFSSEQTVETLKSDTVRTFSPVNDNANEITGKSNLSSNELDLQKNKEELNNVDYSENYKDGVYLQEVKDMKSQSKLSTPLFPNIDVYITANNYKQFLNFNYHTTTTTTTNDDDDGDDDNILKNDTQDNSQMNIIQ